MERAKKIDAAVQMVRENFDTDQGREKFLRQFEPDVAEAVREALQNPTAQAESHATESVFQESVA